MFQRKMSTLKPTKSDFTWGARLFVVEEWNDGHDTRVLVKALGQDCLVEIWDHEGAIEIRWHDQHAPRFIAEAVRNWLKSDFRKHMSLEQFLEQMFPT